MHSNENFHSRLPFLSIQMKLLENKIYRISKKVSEPINMCPKLFFTP